MTDDKQEISRQDQLDSEVLKKMNGGYVECENPNEMLYKFEGSMGLGGERKDCIVSLNNDQMLLRGSSLRNTEFIYGLVVFTGHETKIMKNSVGSKAKFSKLEKANNIYIFQIVLIQFCISIIGAIFNTALQVIYYNQFNDYLILDKGETYGVVLNFIV